MIDRQLNQIYRLLLERFGPQKWWPGETKFEVIVGAILTQNTNWNNVEKAIDNLRADNLLHPGKLHQLPQPRLAELIRPAGYYKVKAKRLKNFLDWLFDSYDGNIDNLRDLDTDLFKDELLAVKGIGPETADSILLYAFDRCVFVVDTYTARLAVRHQLIEPDIDYHQLQYLFESNLPQDIAMFNEFHALLVKVGKEFCRPKPRCSGCPLRDLPHKTRFEEF